MDREPEPEQKVGPGDRVELLGIHQLSLSEKDTPFPAQAGEGLKEADPQVGGHGHRRFHSLMHHTCTGLPLCRTRGETETSGQ